MKKINVYLHTFCSELMELMPQLMRGFIRYEHDSLQRGTITPVQFWALDYLYNKGALPMSDFAHYLGITKPSATALINRLITQKLVVRQHDANDRRIVRIALTAQGKKLTASIKQQRYHALRSIFGKIEQRDRSEYLRIIKEVVRVLG